MNTLGYIISYQKNKEINYICYSANDGCYWWWSSNISNAKIFKTKKEAIKRLKEKDFIQKDIMMDGTIYPPTMIRAATDINNKNPSKTVNIVIQKLQLGHNEWSSIFSGKIEKPIGFIYNH